MTDGSRRPIRINIGCGLNTVDGWVNIDRSPGVLLSRFPRLRRVLHSIGVIGEEHMVDWPSDVRRYDVTKGLPFDDGSVDAIYSSHTLEHLYLDDARRVLEECYRVLRPGGRLRLALPDAGRLIREFQSSSAGGNSGKGDEHPAISFSRDLNAHPLSRPSLIARLRMPFGASLHRWQPTLDLARHLLERAGFEQVEKKDFQDGSLPDLREIEHRRDSLFVEATRVDGSTTTTGHRG